MPYPKAKVPNVINETDYPTNFLTSIVEKAMHQADFSNRTFYALFKKSKFTYIWKGTGRKSRIQIFLAPRAKRFKNIFPINLNQKGILFQSRTSHTIHSRIEMLVFLIAHEIRHAKGAMGEAVCNEFAWKFTNYYRKHRWSILRRKHKLETHGEFIVGRRK